MDSPQSKTYVVTGAASGIGLEVARQLLDGGATVIATARSEERCAEIRRELAAAGDAGGARLRTVVIELSSLASVRAGAARIRELAPALDGLVNNAGVLETARRLGSDGHEMTWSVNVVAPFLLMEELASALALAPEPRIVNVGSVAHKTGRLDLDDPEFARRRFGGFAAYGQSKLALNLLTAEFARRRPEIAANVVHPGGIGTSIYRNVPGFLRAVLARVLPPAAMGAVPVVRLATDPALARVTGHYFDKLRDVAPSAASRDAATARRLVETLAAATTIAL